MTRDSLSEGKSEVLRILERCPETRNSDLLLSWIYFKEVLGIDMPPLSPQDLVRLEGKMETVRRMRAHIQNDLKIYPPTRREVLEKRRQREEDYENWFISRGRDRPR